MIYLIYIYGVISAIRSDRLRLILKVINSYPTSVIMNEFGMKMLSTPKYLCESTMEFSKNDSSLALGEMNY